MVNITDCKRWREGKLSYENFTSMEFGVSMRDEENTEKLVFLLGELQKTTALIQSPLFTCAMSTVFAIPLRIAKKRKVKIRSDPKKLFLDSNYLYANKRRELRLAYSNSIIPFVTRI